MYCRQDYSEGCLREVGASDVYRFFFQAEDGIRDVAVTGVQTCALPIYHAFSIGIKPLFDGDEAPSGAPVDFEVMAVDAEGKPIDRAGLSYRFVEEDWDYQDRKSVV